MPLERKETKLREVRDIFERRTFYCRLREERAAFLELRSLEKAKTELIRREAEIKKMLLSNEITPDIRALYYYTRSYAEDMKHGGCREENSGASGCKWRR